MSCVVCFNKFCSCVYGAKKPLRPFEQVEKLSKSFRLLANAARFKTQGQDYDIIVSCQNKKSFTEENPKSNEEEN